MDAQRKISEIHQIIEKSTAEGIANNELPLAIDLKPTEAGALESNLYSQFSRLFIEHMGDERMQVMRELFPAISDDMPDLNSLHAFLKEISAMLGWTEPGAVKRLLGVRAARDSLPGEPILEPDSIEDEHLLELEDFEDLDDGNNHDTQRNLSGMSANKLPKESVQTYHDMSSSITSKTQSRAISGSTRSKHSQMRLSSESLPQTDLPNPYLGFDSNEQEGFEVWGAREIRAAEEGDLHQDEPFSEAYDYRHQVVLVEKYSDNDDDEERKQ